MRKAFAWRTRRFAAFAAVALIVATTPTGCGGMRERAKVRDGLLVTGLEQHAFMRVWGPPARTYTASGAEGASVSWSMGGGEFAKGAQVLDVWEYPARGVTLMFRRDRLVAWKTDKTVNELAQH